MSRIDITSAGGSATLPDGMLQTANPLNSTLQVVTDNVGNSSTLLLSTIDTQINSVLRIKTDDAELLDIENGSGNRFNINRNVQKINLDFMSNPTGSTTLVGAIRTFQDGVNLSDAMSFIEDGSIGIGTNSPLGLLHLKRTAATTRMVIDGDAAQNKIITYRTAGLQRFGLYVNNTAESGSNAGSDFQIRAYSDAGTLLTTPVFIKRSTGNIGFGTTAPTSKLQIVGTGTTSATTSLLVQNSAGTQYFKVADDGVVSLGTTATISTNVMTNVTQFVSATAFRFDSAGVVGVIRMQGNQIGMGNNTTGDASALLTLTSTTKGFLPPRMTTIEKNAIAAPAAGLVIYDTTLNKLCVRTAAAWETITSL